MSLTRSYKAPTLSSLLGRPSLSFRFPVPGANTPTSPDRAGNPNLKPELATGIDLAAERYLAAGGVLSANIFYRQISDYMRSVTTLETVSWAPVPRWVSRPQNVGDATTQGLELEAKFRLSEVMADAPPLEFRSNASFFHSRVKSVPGPNNRLDQQPACSTSMRCGPSSPAWRCACRPTTGCRATSRWAARSTSNPAPAPSRARPRAR
jgi:iron complex outermembrane receptor protein